MNRRLLVDLEALATNYQAFCAASAPGGTVGAVVKADGYGVGARRVSLRLRQEGCRSFFVATLEEGIALREALGPEAEVYIFEGVDDRSAPAAADAALIPVLNDPAQLESWHPYADRAAAVHFDTGMSRLGFPAQTPVALFDSYNICLIMTHLACADESGHGMNERQIRRFAAHEKQFPGVPTSVGNSAGWLTGAPFQGDLGRPGIGLYGGNPFRGRPSPMQPVVALQGRLLQVKTLAAGESVGYGATCTLAGQTRVGVVGMGYADGLPRQLSGSGALVVGGVRCPILGRVSMDSAVVDLTAVPEAAVGDWAECFGAAMSVDEVAERAGTIAYDLFTGVSGRVPRVEQALS